MDEAETQLAYVYRSLFWLAVAAAVGGLVQPNLLLVALLFATLGLLLRQYHSRTAALVVAVIAAANLARVLTTTTVVFPASGSDFIRSLFDLADGVLGSTFDLCAAIAAVYAASRYQVAENAFNRALAQAEKARSA
jgi:uncharacterized protein involved in propanediol utilization